MEESGSGNPKAALLLDRFTVGSLRYLHQVPKYDVHHIVRSKKVTCRSCQDLGYKMKRGLDLICNLLI